MSFPESHVNERVRFFTNQTPVVQYMNTTDPDNPDTVTQLTLDPDTLIPTADILLRQANSTSPIGFNGSYDNDGNWTYNRTAKGMQLWCKFREPYWVTLDNSDPVAGGGTFAPVVHIYDVITQSIGANPSAPDTFGVAGGNLWLMCDTILADYDPTKLTFLSGNGLIGGQLYLEGDPYVAEVYNGGLAWSHVTNGNQDTIPLNNSTLDDINTRDFWSVLTNYNFNETSVLPPVTINSFYWSVTVPGVPHPTADQVRSVFPKYIGAEFAFYFPSGIPFGFGMSGFRGYKIIKVEIPPNFDSSNPQIIITVSPSFPSAKAALPSDPSVPFSFGIISVPIYGFVLTLSTGVVSQGDAGPTAPPFPYYGTGSVSIKAAYTDPVTGKTKCSIEVFE